MDPSKKRSFEDHWKEAFDEASVPPPASAWEGIDARLDQNISERGFEDQWRKAFDEASVIPPATAWEGIEARLDEHNNDKIIPLWWRSPKLWFAAASVVTLLLAGGIWLKNGLSDNTTHKTDIAVSTKPAVKTEAVIVDSLRITPGSADKDKDRFDERTADLAKQGAVSTGNAEASEVGRNTKDSFGKASAALKFDSDDKKRPLLAKTENQVQSDKILVNVPEAALTPLVTEGKSVAMARAAANVKPAKQGRPQVSAKMLAALPYKDLDVYFQKRYVFYKEEVEPEMQVVKKHQEYWAGIGLMPASFNPDVNLKTSPTSFATQSYASQKSLTGKNDPGFSYVVQTQGGARISKHWSVETGISYLQGKANYEGGGYLLDAATNWSSNVLENALSDVYSTQKGSPTNSLTANNVYIDVSKQVRNDYQYLQLPVQAGFTLNPDGKLSYSVLGGMMANFFLNNELESANGSVIKTTASDEVYRGINWSATTGLRFNYKVSSRWRASLTGSYQKAVTSGFRTNQNLESHPYLYGVSWGMRYSF